MIYSEALAWLYSTQHHGIKLGLENIRRLFRELGVGQPAAKVLHVAGTNGKGSVCAMLDSICRAQGYRTGLYTSPHLVDFRERIKINGEMISPEAVAGGLTRIFDLTAAWEDSPTFFEIVTALALLHFQQKENPVGIIILETGLGGRLDATNAITPAVTVFTPVDLDHQAYLGGTLTAIAGEKAGIIKPAIPIVSSPQPGEVVRVFEETAASKQAPLEFVKEPLCGYEIGLEGDHQQYSAAVALKALQWAGIALSPESIRTGLSQVQWPGRFQRFRPQGKIPGLPPEAEIILDGAHNQAAANQLARTWRKIFGARKATIILGILRDKDAPAICHALRPIAASFILTPVRSERSCSAQELIAAFGPAHTGPLMQSAADLPGAFAAAAAAAAEQSGPILVTGSLFLVGEALALFEGKQTRPSLQ